MTGKTGREAMQCGEDTGERPQRQSGKMHAEDKEGEAEAQRQG